MYICIYKNNFFQCYYFSLPFRTESEALRVSNVRYGWIMYPALLSPCLSVSDLIKHGHFQLWGTSLQKSHLITDIVPVFCLSPVWRVSYSPGSPVLGVSLGFYSNDQFRMQFISCGCFCICETPKFHWPVWVDNTLLLVFWLQLSTKLYIHTR